MRRTLRRPGSYDQRVLDETNHYADVAVVHDLPPMFHYWSNTFVRPMLEEHGFSSPTDFFRSQLLAAADPDPVAILSLGSGNCDLEVGLCESLVAAGRPATFDCLELNPRMLGRAQQLATEKGVVGHFSFVECDVNQWVARRKYDFVIANQSLHHITGLEKVFDQVKGCLQQRGRLLVSDMIGRNGHRRWPEALAEVRRFWEELPPRYRYNHQLGRQERSYVDWDCSHEGFEGIRAQDILPLLMERFRFHLFIAFGNIIDPFVERSFGPNFRLDEPWDRAFVDRVHARDEELLRCGAITPTHLIAVLANDPAAAPRFARGLTPNRCVRRP
jgi:SAM-dependent methyltransferase